LTFSLFIPGRFACRLVWYKPRLLRLPPSAPAAQPTGVDCLHTPRTRASASRPCPPPSVASGYPAQSGPAVGPLAALLPQLPTLRALPPWRPRTPGGWRASWPGTRTCGRVTWGTHGLVGVV